MQSIGLFIQKLKKKYTEVERENSIKTKACQNCREECECPGTVVEDDIDNYEADIDHQLVKWKRGNFSVIVVPEDSKDIIICVNTFKICMK